MQTTQRLSGRKAKKWLESRFNSPYYGSGTTHQEIEMIEQSDLAGSFTLPGKAMTLNRIGYGAMQLAGPGVWGPPRDVNSAIAVLR
jgi:hypothetical protein